MKSKEKIVTVGDMVIIGCAISWFTLLYWQDGLKVMLMHLFYSLTLAVIIAFYQIIKGKI